MSLVSFQKKENAMKTTVRATAGRRTVRRMICQTQTLKKLRLYLESEDPKPAHYSPTELLAQDYRSLSKLLA